MPSVASMTIAKFDHVDTWVFDLDHTLYHPSVRLFDQIEVLMTQYIVDALGVSKQQANALRAEYWRDHGTTLAGLMHHHDVDPDPYLIAVHDIDFSVLTPDPKLARAVRNLPGRKIVYTNGSADYACKVLNARGLNGIMDAVFGVEDANYIPKPEKSAFEEVFLKAGVTPTASVMFEDDVRNLKAPHAMGMRTVHVADDADPAPHIDRHTADLTGFLSHLAD